MPEKFLKKSLGVYLKKPLEKNISKKKKLYKNHCKELLEEFLKNLFQNYLGKTLLYSSLFTFRNNIQATFENILKETIPEVILRENFVSIPG